MYLAARATVGRPPGLRAAKSLRIWAWSADLFVTKPFCNRLQNMSQVTANCVPSGAWGSVFIAEPLPIKRTTKLWGGKGNRT